MFKRIFSVSLVSLAIVTLLASTAIGASSVSQIPSVTLNKAPISSNGSDGDVTFDGSSTVLGIAPTAGTYVLTRDIYPNNMTVTSSATVNFRGFVPYVKNTFTVQAGGHFGVYGNDAVTSTIGGFLTNIGSLSTNAGAGGAAVSTASDGTGGAGSGGRNVAGSTSGNGGNCSSGGSYNGGAGASSSAPTAAQGSANGGDQFYNKRLPDGTTINGSNGGASGAACPNTGTATSGAGGGGAPYGQLVCKNFANSGTADVRGGKGGDASACTGNGAAGGGGQGANGRLDILCENYLSQGTLTTSYSSGVIGTGCGGGNSGVAATAGKINLF